MCATWPVLGVALIFDHIMPENGGKNAIYITAACWQLVCFLLYSHNYL
jgi:hypothetical protein